MISGISAVAEALAGLDSMLGRNPDAGDLGVIELGSYTLFDSTVPDTPPPTPAGLRATALAVPNLAPAAAPDANGITHEAPGSAPLDQIADKIRQFGLLNDTSEGAGGLGNAGESPFKSGFRDHSGLSLPLFNDISDDPTTVIKLLFGCLFGNEPVDIIVYDFPAREFGASYEQFFPIIGPLGAKLFGGFDGYIDIQVGYDSYGLQQGLTRFADGFYFSTQPFTEGSPTREPLAHLEAVVQASAAVEAAICKAGVGGGIRGTINAYLNAGPDGKLRLGEIADLGLDCIITPVDGKVTAELFGEITIGRSPFSWTRHITIADTTLLDFSFGCHGPDDPANRGLATLGRATVEAQGFGDFEVPANTLLLNAGKLFAHLREFDDGVPAEYRTDIDEHFAVRNAVDANGAPIAGALEVAAFTVVDGPFGGAGNDPTLILADFGDDNDSLVIAADVTVAADVSGGDGDDVLFGGGGNDRLLGNNDSDGLTGAGGGDTLLGGDGDDILDGGKGADSLDGGSGRDQVSYEASDAGVRFTEVAGEKAFQGSGGDAEGDQLRSVEYIIGSRFNDTLLGNGSQENILEGIGGNDVLTGGSKDDFLIGGKGADAMHGGKPGTTNNGNDATSYVTSTAGVRVDLRTGHVGRGGDAEGDTLTSVETVYGSSFDDVLIGNESNNELEGWLGNDILEGGLGRDKVYGSEGNDTVNGGTDGDTLDGGEGRDLLNYRRVAGPVTVNLLTGDGAGSDRIALRTYTPPATDASPEPDPVIITGYSSFEDLDGTDAAAGDRLTGDEGFNRIRGFAGNDTLDGGGGGDTLVGGAGEDSLVGGAGVGDWADYSSSGGRVSVNLGRVGTAMGQLNDAQGDMLTGVENLRGSDFADELATTAGIHNVIDPGLSRGGGFDVALGRDSSPVAGEVDTLRVDYSRGDYGKGMVGGFALGETSFGTFAREQRSTTAVLDQVRFLNIDRLEVHGTIQGDSIYGGAG